MSAGKVRLLLVFFAGVGCGSNVVFFCDARAAEVGNEVVKADARSWPLARGDSFATGVAGSELPAKPQQLWKVAFEKTTFESIPAIVDGVVYVGEMNEKLYALRLSDGSKIWEFPGTLGFPAPPAVKDGKLYVGDGDGVFYCLNAADAKVIWKFTTEAEIVAGANFAGDKVLVGSQDSRVYCLNANTGELAWKLQIDNQIRTMATVADDRAFVAQCDGTLHVVELKGGTIVASVALNQPNTTSCPAVLGDRLYFGTEEGSVMSVDWKKAEIAWQVSDDKRGQAFRSSPAVAKDLVVIGSRGKRVLAFSPDDGKALWSFPTKNRVDCSPVIVGDRVLVGAVDGRLYLIDRADGKETWQTEIQGGVTGGPAVADGKFVVATDRGTVYCFGEKK